MQSNTKGTNPTIFLNQMDRTIQTTEREIEEKERLLRGLRSARESMAAVVLEGASQPRLNGENPRSSVLREILEAASGPVPVDDIMAELRKRDVIAPRASVGATLSYLKRKGVAKNVDRGQWVAVTQRQAA